ncbi:MAG: hypothetical protein U5O39_11770 [Gammaproteobacteria bacterium]|nr:hypothetical protein [Gammaproteobacteria bacterium]
MIPPRTRRSRSRPDSRTWGDIILDQVDSSSNSATLTLGLVSAPEILENTSTDSASLVFANSGGGGGVAHTLTAVLQNGFNGFVSVETDATIQGDGALHTNDGFTVIEPGRTLTVTGSSFTNNPNETQATIVAGGDIDVSGPTGTTAFTNNGFFDIGTRRIRRRLRSPGTSSRAPAPPLLLCSMSTRHRTMY